MQHKQIVKPAVVAEYMTGPDAANGIRYCIICRKEFAEGETWLGQTRLHEYSVGIHTACAAKNTAAAPQPAA